VLDFATNAARSVLGQIGVVDHRIEHLTEVEDKLHEAVDALHRTAASLDRHVEAVEALGDSLPALTAAVTQLCDQLTAVLELAAPVEAAEHEVEGGLRRLLHLSRRRHATKAALPPAGPPGP
jgi:uncharacterized protein YoxC